MRFPGLLGVGMAVVVLGLGASPASAPAAGNSLSSPAQGSLSSPPAAIPAPAVPVPQVPRWVFPDVSSVPRVPAGPPGRPQVYRAGAGEVIVLDGKVVYRSPEVQGVQVTPDRIIIQVAPRK